MLVLEMRYERGVEPIACYLIDKTAGQHIPVPIGLREALALFQEVDLGPITAVGGFNGMVHNLKGELVPAAGTIQFWHLTGEREGQARRILGIPEPSTSPEPTPGAVA